MKYRKTKITAIATAASFIALVGYAIFFCVRNEQVRNDWSDWTSHLSGPPTSWQGPSNELQRFSASLPNKNTELYGYQNSAGDVVIPPRFSPCAERFYDGLAWVWDPAAERSGYINPDGSWAIIVNGSTHTSFIGGMGEFQVIGEDGFPKYGYVNRQGKEVVPPIYRTATWYVDGYVLVGRRTWIGMITDKIALELGGFPNTCLDTRLVILNQSGQEAQLPERVKSSD